MRKHQRALVLDTSAFISGFDPLALAEETYSVPEVRDELLDGSMAKTRFDASIETGKLKIIEPETKYIEQVKSISTKVGDIGLLSEADLAVLALALKLKEAGLESIIATDDYSIQNVAERMGLKFIPLANLGIRYQLHWVLYCPACGNRYPPEEKVATCINCGTELKRKPIRRKPVKRKT
ncbi:MAG: NOB1 family endonuclease [Candidatus Bathyarchaeia archaeon]